MRAVWWLGWWGCHEPPTTDGDGSPSVEDRDGDGYTSALDCDDDAPEVHPGAEDVSYDGVDADCAQDDDYDQDGDGHPSADYGGDDCFDQNAAISPSAPEAPYDAVDNDCDPTTPDDDVDLDGFILAFDCDDDDPDTYPGALERVNDGEDDDCDGVVDGSWFGSDDLTWIDPTRPRLAVTDDWVVAIVTAHQVESPTYLPEGNEEVGVLLTLDRAAAGPAPLATAPLLWHGLYEDDDLAEADAVASGSRVSIGAAWYSAINRFGWLAVYDIDWLGPGVGWRQTTASFLSEPLQTWTHVAVARDRYGERWACGSGDASVVYLQADGTIGSPGGMAPTDGSEGCLAEPPSLVTVDAFGAPTSWSTDPEAADPTPTVAPSQPYDGEHWASVRAQDGLVTAIALDGGVRVIDAPNGVDVTVLDVPGRFYTDAQAIVDDDGTLWLAAVADEGFGNRVLLAFGPLAGPFEERWYELDALGTLAPLGVALALVDDRVVIAANAVPVIGSGKDVVAWVVLGK